MTTRLDRTDPERGSASMWAAIIAVAVLAVLGLVVDGSSKLRAARDVTTTAQEAARAGGSAIGADAMRGQRADLDPSKAAEAARAYLRLSGQTGTVSVSGSSITVTVTDTWHPAFLAGFGVADQPVTATATIDTRRVHEGSPA